MRKRKAKKAIYFNVVAGVQAPVENGAGPENVDWPNISAWVHYFVDGDFGRARRTAKTISDGFGRPRTFSAGPQKKAGQTLTL